MASIKAWPRLYLDTSQPCSSFTCVHVDYWLLQETGESPFPLSNGVSPQISTISRGLPAHVKFAHWLVFWTWTFIKDVFILSHRQGQRKWEKLPPPHSSPHRTIGGNIIKTIMQMRLYFFSRIFSFLGEMCFEESSRSLYLRRRGGRECVDGCGRRVSNFNGPMMPVQTTLALT